MILGFLLFTGSSFCQESSIFVKEGDEASSVTPPTTTEEIIITSEPAVEQQVTGVSNSSYAAIVQEDALLTGNSLSSVDDKNKKSLKQDTIPQAIIDFFSEEQAKLNLRNSSQPEGEKESIASGINLQSKLQEDKLILSSPVPLFLEEI